MTKKCILILLDGVGDRSFSELGGKTPLQAARTPVMDRIAASGANGLYHADSQGKALPSENAHFAMFGYDSIDFPGRGALEALGAGIELGLTDVALLAHFASLTEKDGCLSLKDGKPKISDEQASAFIAAAKPFSRNGIDMKFVYTHLLNGILLMQGNACPFITDTDPLIAGRKLIAPRPFQSFENDSKALNCAAVLKEFLLYMYQVLKDHPVNRIRKQNGLDPINGMVTQRAGRLKPVIPFTEKYGLQGLSIASGIVYHGLSKFLGIDCIKVQDTENPGNDLAKRLEIAHKATGRYDFVHVHTKTPDEAAHKKDPVLKTEVIEALDDSIGRSIDPILSDPDIYIVLTADHSTPSSGVLIHSGEPVPVVLSGTGVRRDKVIRFDEISAAAGVLGQVRKKELIYLILNHLDRSKLVGLMDTPVDQCYWPGNYEPFQLQED